MWKYLKFSSFRKEEYPQGGGGRNNDRKYIIECFRHIADTSVKG